MTVLATDKDVDENARIRYVLLRGGRDNFAIDADSGLLSVATNADLDIERYGDQYDMILSIIKRALRYNLSIIDQ